MNTLIYIINKASRLLEFSRLKLLLSSTKTSLLEFKSFVRSQLEYAGIIWALYRDYLFDKIESIQNKGARSIFKNYLPSTDV